MRAGAPKPMHAGAPNPMHAEVPNPMHAGAFNPLRCVCGVPRKPKQQAMSARTALSNIRSGTRTVDTHQEISPPVNMIVLIEQLAVV